MTEKKPYGKLIGASLGPGDPELITRRSWAVLQSGARWIYPVKKAEEPPTRCRSSNVAAARSRPMPSNSSSR
jgi:precorrin-2 methylase